VGLEGIGAASHRVSGLPALPAPTAIVAPPGPVRVEVERLRPAPVDEVVEIRLGFDGATGRLTIAAGDVRRRLLAEPPAAWAAPSDPTLLDRGASIGSRVDLVA
jgi:hypothetical protein